MGCKPSPSCRATNQHDAAPAVLLFSRNVLVPPRLAPATRTRVRPPHRRKAAGKASQAGQSRVPGLDAQSRENQLFYQKNRDFPDSL